MPAPARPSVRKGISGRTSSVLSGAALLGLAGMAAVAGNAELVEYTYSRNLGLYLNLALTAFTGRVPLSVAEAAVVIGATGGAMVAIRAMIRASLRDFAQRLAAGAAVAAFLFYALWGLNYARPELASRQGWGHLAGDTSAPVEELAALAGHLVAATNQAYRDAHNVDDLGYASTPTTDLIDLDRALDEGFLSLASTFDWPPAAGVSRGPAKQLRSSAAFTRLGISGIYIPWTGEANYNNLIPGVQLPHTIAHEKAHQRGIASEDEANFVGFVAASRAPDAYARYSALLFAQRQLLSELASRAPLATGELVAGRLPGVQRDVDAVRAFWARTAGPAREAQEAFNDRYLRFHRVEGGIASYSRSARLLVLYARTQGGCLDVPADHHAGARVVACTEAANGSPAPES